MAHDYKIEFIVNRYPAARCCRSGCNDEAICTVSYLRPGPNGEMRTAMKYCRYHSLIFGFAHNLVEWRGDALFLKPSATNSAAAGDA